MADEPTDKESNQDKEDFGALSGGDDSESGGAGADDSDSFGTGSLPPLSDFDSGESEGEGDSDLPPLETPDADEDEGPISGLPPIVDIRVDTPAVRPSDLDTPTPSKPDEPETPTPEGFDTPSDALDSPEPAGLGFQDFAADSDFSPETPEIGPGPDSDIETPMFDSAFGGDTEDLSAGGTATSAPTQAMETPLFGSQPEGAGGKGFDDDAFGVPTPDMGADSGTPVPDFSPDTGGGAPTDTGIPAAAMAGPPRKRGRAVGILVSVALVVVGVAVGVVAAQFFDIRGIPILPDPATEAMAAKDAEIGRLEGRVASLLQATPPGQEPLSPEEVDLLIKRYENTKAMLKESESDLEINLAELGNLENSLELVRADIEEKTGAYVEAQEALEGLKNENAITEARHRGLLAENERLSEVVGELEVANARRQSTKDTLLHNIDLLIVQVQGGSPLAPERYEYAARLARVNNLRDKVARAKWVDPQLLDEYTNLYLAELGIASSREYFFARIPVHNQLDNIVYRWAECLMNGSWSVYFSTIDGKHVGSYENAAGSGPPRYEFREDLPGGMRSDILDAIKASRVEDYKEKIAVLEQKQKIYEDKSKYQIDFTSL
ncbi:MAG: hypothetical protein QGD90_10400 [Candidatus Hydrogenedentes bacterium]|nr:hypothetical protein [Candidatus Hydrogenedentota bacterium]